MSEIGVALNRFGLGARPSDLGLADARGWLSGQMERFRPAIDGGPDMADRAAVVGALGDYRAAQRDKRERADGGATAAPAPMAGMDESEKAIQQYARQQHVIQVGARVRSAIATDTPFVERLVHFWSNHFAVSADKRVTVALAGLMEFEVIRPHVLGRFEDMLLAVEQHPAMLLYLDQAQSVGPDSPAGLWTAAGGGRGRGLNENLGREILELHTLGVRTGYGQADVTELARALTGWTLAGLGRGGAERAPGEFLFAGALHEPGERTILGRRYGQQGEAQARAVLADLAVHPATARHLATKLARHFAADDPPPALVATLERAYLSSGGDLPTVYRALIDAPESWAPGTPKFRTPWEWTIALFRAVEGERSEAVRKIPDRSFVGMVTELGQPVWRPGSPAGYDDIAASWAGPDALFRRVELAERLAAQAPSTVDARALAKALFGDMLSAATEQAIARADSPQQGLALLFVAPEMLRR